MFGRKMKFRDLSDSERKDLTRILVIDDDNQTELLDYSKNHKWIVRQISDLDSFDQAEVKDSHIICIDINGVGDKLGKNNGLDLLLSLKKKYPFKKYIIYSTQPVSDFFHEANSYIDKRIPKRGDFEPFISAYDELSKSLFNWASICRRIFDELSPFFPNEMNYYDFKKKFEKIPYKNLDSNLENIAKVFKVNSKAVEFILPLIKLLTELVK